MTDADLAARVARRDDGALETLYDEFGGAVKGVARRVLRDEARAEDVVQDTFVTFWSSPEKFDPLRGSLRAFLLTIAHRRSVDVVRSQVARSQRESRPPDPDYSADVEETVWAMSLSRQVRSALATLESGERDAITLAYYGGLSYAQVAKELGAPEGTVKSRIRSGMKKLSRSLADLAP